MTSHAQHSPSLALRKHPSRRLATPPALQLTERDLAILDALRQHHLLTGIHVTWLFFPGSPARARGVAPAAARRMRLLYDARLVKRIVRPGPQRAQEPIAYALDRGGAYELVAAGLAGSDHIHVRAPLPWPAQYDHDLAVSGVWAVLGAACTGGADWRLAEWRGSRELWAAMVPVRHEQMGSGQGNRAQARLPDATFQLTAAPGVQAQCAPFCLVVDHPTDLASEVGARLQRIAACPSFHDHVLLVVAQSAGRLNYLGPARSAVAMAPALADRLLAADMEALTPQTALGAWQPVPDALLLPEAGPSPVAHGAHPWLDRAVGSARAWLRHTLALDATDGLGEAGPPRNPTQLDLDVGGRGREWS